MSDTESNPSVNEEINEDINIQEDGEPTKSLQKPKKPRTEKQKEALKRAQIKRAENIEKRKAEKEEIKLEKEQEKLDKKKSKLKADKEINPSNNGFNEKDYSKEIEDNKDMLKKMAISKPRKKPVKQTIIYQSDSSETEEEEIIIMKKPQSRRKRKKPVKKKVVYESESSSSEEEEEEQITKSIQKNNYQTNNTPTYRQKLKYSDVFKFQ